MRTTFLAIAACAVLGATAPVQAGAPSMAKDAGAFAPNASTQLELVNHGGRSCQLGPRGWHFHDRFGDRIVCNPRPRGVFYIWREEGNRRGWYHRGFRRWH